MPYDPNFPPDHQALNAAPFRAQFNGLAELVTAMQDQVTALQMQLAPLVPVVNRSASGEWTLTYNGPAQDYWQVWARYAGSEAWSNFGEIQTSSFPASDSDVVPDGVTWWQVKLCGEGAGDSLQHTPFSNIISFGPVPEA